MTSQDTTPPEFAATAEALRLYSLHGSFSLFTLTCLLHRADPAKVTEVTTFEWAMYERKLGGGTFVRTGTASQAAYLARLTYTPEVILGDLIGGTVKRLQTAACQVDLKAHVTREKAAQLADLLGMELPPEIGLTFPAKAPEPAPASTTTMPGISAPPAWRIKDVKRARGYTMGLINVLRAAQRAGEPRPSARDVLEAWRSNRPPEINQVLQDGFNYYDAAGNIKATTIEALSKAIKRLTN